MAYGIRKLNDNLQVLQIREGQVIFQIVTGQIVVDNTMSLGNGTLRLRFIFFRHKITSYDSIPRLCTVMYFNYCLSGRFNI